MIEETALVVETEDGFAWLEAQRKTACGQCAVQKGCGTGVLSKVVGKRITRIKALNEVQAQVGESVIVGLSESSLLKSAFVNYLVPLFLMFAGALIARFVFGPVAEPFIVIGALAGLAFSLWVIRKFADHVKHDQRYQPIVLRKVDGIKLL